MKVGHIFERTQSFRYNCYKILKNFILHCPTIFHNRVGFSLSAEANKKKKNKGFLAKWFFSTDLIKIWAQEILIFGEYILECNAMENVYDLISENVG